MYGEKKTLRSSQDSNLGPLNSGQMLLPMSYWSSGIGAEDRWHLSIDTVRFSARGSIRKIVKRGQMNVSLLFILGSHGGGGGGGDLVTVERFLGCTECNLDSEQAN